MSYKTETMRFETEPPPNFRKRTLVEAFCAVCHRQVDLIEFEAAARMLGINQDEFYRMAEKGKVHRLHNSAGRILICLKSLEYAESLQKTRVIILKPLQEKSRIF